jgi:alkane 1-monooxygenase
MKRSLPFAFSFIIPAVSAVAVAVGGAALVLPPVFIFVVTPLMDTMSGLEKDDVEASGADRWRDLRYDVWLWLWIPVQLAIQAAALVSLARLHHAGALDAATFAGLVLASGLLGGTGINVAHELMHRKGRPERAAAEVLMTSVAYGHFCVEHVLGHHKNVATPLDPASATRGENVYAFLVRSVVGGVKSAWSLETARVEKLGLRPFSLADRRLRLPLALASVLTIVVVVAGPVGLAWFAAQSAVAIALLEVINYVEHYGLARAEVSPGVYERVRPEHSWSSAHRLTNWYLFHLPRHADHHAVASRPYFALRHVDDSPQLPAGYAAMLLCALVPPLWRAVMDPRVDAWNGARASASAADTLAA